MVKRFNVTENDTAVKVGSGSLEVLATPVLAAWIENVATLVAAPFIKKGETSVGTTLNLEHLRKSLVGETIEVSVELTAHEGRQMVFAAECCNTEGVCVGRATHTRFVVNIERFMGR